MARNRGGKVVTRKVSGVQWTLLLTLPSEAQALTEWTSSVAIAHLSGQHCPVPTPNAGFEDGARGAIGELCNGWTATPVRV